MEEQTPKEPTPAEGEGAAPEQGEMCQLRAQLDEALREKDQFRAMAQRAQADLANYKRRAAEEQGELRRTANAQLILKILSVVDDLERGLALVPQDAQAPGWLEGLQLVHRNLSNILEAEGITKIAAQGQPFQPWEHEAVLYEESSDGPAGIVVRVIRDGYKHHQRVLRPAQVAVSKAPQPQDFSQSA